MLLWGSHEPQPGHAGYFSLLAGLGREVYFCLDGPTGSSVSIKGPESSPCSSLCTRANSLSQVRARKAGRNLNKWRLLGSTVSWPTCPSGPNTGQPACPRED